MLGSFEGPRVDSSTPERWDDLGTLNLQELFARLWNGRWWIVGSVACCIGTALAVALLSTPVYRATTVLISASTDRAGLGNSLSSALGQLGGVAALAGVNLAPNTAETEEALAVLRSREFTEKFIREEALMPVLFEKKWDASAHAWLGRPDQHPTVAQAFRYFDRSVRTVTQDKKTGLVALYIDWKNREQAAAWANEQVRRLNAEMRRRAIEQADASVGFLQKELAGTTVVDTRSAINRLIETQINKRMLANVSQEYAFRVVDRAMAPDVGDTVWPKKGLLLLGGTILGLGIGCVLAYLIGSRRSVDG
jgi:uncharacterized protein involved in exopolysaccharide biosynthesis